MLVKQVLIYRTQVRYIHAKAAKLYRTVASNHKQDCQIGRISPLPWSLRSPNDEHHYRLAQQWYRRYPPVTWHSMRMRRCRKAGRINTPQLQGIFTFGPFVLLPEVSWLDEPKICVSHTIRSARFCKFVGILFGYRQTLRLYTATVITCKGLVTG